MATEKEIERLVVRLIGDGSKYQKMLKDAEVSTKKTTAQIDKSIKKFDVLQKKLNAIGAGFKSAGQKMRAVGTKLSLAVTLPIVGMGLAAIKFGSDFQSGFAGVEKTVDATTEQLAVMRQEFRNLATTEVPIAVEELLSIGEAAGQLGIANDSIIDFTKTMALLGVTTNLESEEAASSLAKFANVTGMSQDKFSNLGSSIVALGNSLATTERDIVSMATRLAGAGSIIGLTESQILAIAGSLSSVGLQAEAGGTAFSKLFLTITEQVATSGKELESFARVSGKTVEEFSNQWRTNAAGAIVDFLSGLNQLETEDKVITLVKDLRIEGTRMTAALLQSSNAVDLMKTALKTSEEAFQENTALAAEAAVRFKTFSAQVVFLKSAFKDLGLEVFIIVEPALRGLIKTIKGVVFWFINLSSGIKKFIVVALIVAAIIAPILLAVATLMSFIGFVASGLAIALPALGAAVAFLGGPIAVITGALLGLMALITAITLGVGVLFKKGKLDINVEHSLKKEAKEEKEAEEAAKRGGAIPLSGRAAIDKMVTDKMVDFSTIFSDQRRREMAERFLGVDKFDANVAILQGVFNTIKDKVDSVFSPEDLFAGRPGAPGTAQEKRRDTNFANLSQQPATQQQKSPTIPQIPIPSNLTDSGKRPPNFQAWTAIQNSALGMSAGMSNFQTPSLQITPRPLGPETSMDPLQFRSGNSMDPPQLRTEPGESQTLSKIETILAEIRDNQTSSDGATTPAELLN